MIVGRVWKAREREYLRANYEKMTDQQIGAFLNRTPGAVRRMRTKMGLRKQEDRPKPAQREEWFNPNPVTTTTKTCICVWYSEGCALREIARMLCRRKTEVEDILNECMENGDYDRFLMVKRKLR